MRQILLSISAVLSGVLLGLFVAFLMGDDPLLVAKVLFNSAFGSWEDFGITLFYTTPLIFTGLSVSLAYRAGLFNIGAEGQLAIGALCAAMVGISWTALPAIVAPIVACICAFLGGAFWGWIPGYIRAKRGGHEVITTIMLNFVAAGICSWVTLNLYRSPHSQSPETVMIAPQFSIPKLSWLGETPLSVAFFLAVAVVAVTWFLFEKTVMGFELRAVGESDSASKYSGLEPGKVRIRAMTCAGGVAGLVGVAEVLGNAGKFKLGFSPDYGFLGIAVALLAHGRPVGVAFAALLFGALHKGTTELDFETKFVTKDLSLVLQAMVILSVSAERVWSKLFARKP